MKGWRVAGAAVGLFWGAGHAGAFVVDGWRSGSTVEEVSQEASREGFSLVPPERATLQRFPTRDRDAVRALDCIGYTYQSEFLDQEAWVTLVFSPVTQRLHTVDVWWPLAQGDERRALVEAARDALTEEFGAAEPCQALPHRYAPGLPVEACWRPDDNTAVMLRVEESRGVSVRYVDRALWEAASGEFEQQRQQKSSGGAASP